MLGVAAKGRKMLRLGVRLLGRRALKRRAAGSGRTDFRY
jgi:hypothetical protein